VGGGATQAYRAATALTSTDVDVSDSQRVAAARALADALAATASPATSRMYYNFLNCLGKTSAADDASLFDLYFGPVVDRLTQIKAAANPTGMLKTFCNV